MLVCLWIDVGSFLYTARSSTAKDVRSIKETPFEEPLRNRMAFIAMVNPFHSSYCLLGLDIY
uniref:Uncharacterized protein n=1 Tax=Fagus sylvatica TaxID=28930 RepID=A0A2N9FPA5_FAGSY